MKLSHILKGRQRTSETYIAAKITPRSPAPNEVLRISIGMSGIGGVGDDIAEERTEQEASLVSCFDLYICTISGLSISEWVYAMSYPELNERLEGRESTLLR